MTRNIRQTVGGYRRSDLIATIAESGKFFENGPTRSRSCERDGVGRNGSASPSTGSEQVAPAGHPHRCGTPERGEAPGDHESKSTDGVRRGIAELLGLVGVTWIYQHQPGNQIRSNRGDSYGEQRTERPSGNDGGLVNSCGSTHDFQSSDCARYASVSIGAEI
jgi:hypothetical protein